MQNIVCEHLCKAYGENVVLNDFSAVFSAGKVSVLMAPSGSGKTTLLRLLMGLECADSGCIHGMEGIRIGAVFQEDRLCENMDAVANIRLVSPQLTRAEVLRAMDAVALRGCADQPVREMSGGMRRRVAILRALLARGDMLVLDEPFKGLDAQTKALVMEDIRRRRAGRTMLLVTHDAQEAEGMEADQVLYLSE